MCDSIAVLIPCYNEAETIGKVIKNIKENLPEATIYVYDNNSTDRTDEMAKKAGAIVRYEKHQGKGNVIRRMFREIDAKCYIMMDGDNTYSSKTARQMVDLVINNNVDMVIGDRLSSTYFSENKRRFHNFGNILIKNIINYIYHSDIKDVMTGYRAFSYQFVKTFPVLSKGFEVETEMTIHSLDKNLLVESIIVDYKDRLEGSTSKLNTFSDGFKVLKTVVLLYKNYKPLSFFVLLTVLFFVIGSVFVTPVLVDYFKTGLVPKFPSFIAAIFFYLCSMQSFFCGLILDNISRKNRQDFEFEYMEYSDKFKEIIENR